MNCGVTSGQKHLQAMCVPPKKHYGIVPGKRCVMSKQYLMKVYPAGSGREVYRNIEICGEESLDRLCGIILDAFDFTDEHLYEFCMDNRMYSKNAYQSDPEGEEPSTDITLDEIGLCKGQKFSLHYDFGDDWMFTITVSKISETEERFEPRIVKAKGHIQQYPDFDEEDWDDE